MAGTSPKKRSKKRTKGRPQSGRPGGPRPAVVNPSGDPRKASRATARDWIAASRPRTLPLAIAPVLVGTGAAIIVTDVFRWVVALFCLVVALSVQIGVNYANDYSDGIRGTDAHRLGPKRLVASHAAKPRTVLIVALGFFGISALAGLALVIRTQQWWMLAVGAVILAAAWFYTGGKRPYGYAALGEVAVFLFFGLVATLGTTWLQALTLTQESWFGAVAIGLIACSVLLANNLRDIDQDRPAGKRTLTVLIGRRPTQALFTVLMLAPFGISGFLAMLYPLAWLTFMMLLAALPAILIVWTYRQPRELLVALSLTSLTALGYAGLLTWAFIG